MTNDPINDIVAKIAADCYGDRNLHIFELEDALRTALLQVAAYQRELGQTRQWANDLAQSKDDKENSL